MIRRLAHGAVLASVAALAVTASAQVGVADRHLVFLREGLDSVFGNYVFAIENESGAEAPFTARVMLPKETVDFQATEGIDPKDVRLADDGVVVERTVPTGLHIVGIGFKADVASAGNAVLTFTPTQDIPSLTLLVPKGSTMSVRSTALVPAGDDGAPGEEYRAYANKEPLAAGQSFTVEVGGLPVGRRSLWGLGAGFGAALLVLGGALAVKTRPKIQDDGAEALLVN